MKPSLFQNRFILSLWRGTLFVVVLVAALEGRAYFMLCAGYQVAVAPGETEAAGATYVSRAAASFDPIIGYRLKPGPTRMLRSYNGEIIFDQKFKANRQGYRAGYDYEFVKKNGVFRIAVLGDSFTAATFLETTWPERLQALLNQNAGKKSYEVFSFATDGGGVKNWNKIFFEEIVPRYEFDALLLVTGSNKHFSKEFFYVASKSQAVYAGESVDPPVCEKEVWSNSKRLYPISEVKSENEIETYRAKPWEFHKRPFRWKVVPYVADYLRKKIERWKTSSKELPRELASQNIKDLPKLGADNIASYWSAKYGEEKARALFSIFEYCRRAEIPVMVAAAPSRNEWMEAHAGHSLLREELSTLAQGMGLLYFDSFSIYQADSLEAALRAYWLKFDAHWNQRGSDLFALKLSNQIKQWWP